MMISKFAVGMFALALCARPALASSITTIGFGGSCDFATCNGVPVTLTGVSTYPLEIQVNAVINYAIDLQLDQPPNETSRYAVDGGISIWDTDGDGIAGFNATGHWTVTGSAFGAEGTLYVSGKFTFTPTYYLDPQELLVAPWAGFTGVCTGYCDGSGEILNDTFGSVNGDFAYPAVPEPTSAALLGVGLFGALIGRRTSRRATRAESGAIQGWRYAS